MNKTPQKFLRPQMLNNVTLIVMVMDSGQTIEKLFHEKEKPLCVERYQWLTYVSFHAFLLKQCWMIRASEITWMTCIKMWGVFIKSDLVTTLPILNTSNFAQSESIDRKWYNIIRIWQGFCTPKNWNFYLLADQKKFNIVWADLDSIYRDYIISKNNLYSD